MKKNISILVGLIISTSLAFAVNDVTLTGSDAKLSVSSYTLVVSGTQRVIDSITVDTASFDVTLAAGASFGVTSADRRKFTVSPLTYVKPEYDCNSSQSSLALNTTQDTGSVTVTVTPSTTDTCGVGGEGGVVSSGGGGGGGGSYASAPASAPKAPAATPATPATPAVAKPSPIAQAVSPVFNKDLKKGSRNDDVKRLQQLLATDKSLYAEGLTTGLFGPATAKAVVKFQLRYKLIKSEKDAGAGNLGPKTRAKMKEVFGQGTSAPPAAPVASEAKAQADLQDQIKKATDLINALLGQLKKK